VSDDYTIVGRIRKPHGVHGELLIEPMCDDPDAIFASGHRVIAGDESGDLLSGAMREMSITRARPFKDGVLVTFREISDRNNADEWRHRYLLVPTATLPVPEEGEVWIHELPGMRVNHVNGAHIGDVSATEEVPQGLLLEVKTSRGMSSIPFLEPIVVNVDRIARVITVDPPDGLLDL
jgi:16S rRNA processing protein RimM